MHQNQLKPHQQPQKVFLAGLSLDFTSDVLLAYFRSRYRSIVSVDLVKPKKAKNGPKKLNNKGSGFMQIGEPEEARAILARRNYSIGGRSFLVKEFKSGAELRKFKKNLAKRRIFLHNIGPEVANEDLRGFFGGFVDVEDAYIINLKGGGAFSRFRYGYLILSDIGQVEAVLRTGRFRVCDSLVIAERYDPERPKKRQKGEIGDFEIGRFQGSEGTYSGGFGGRRGSSTPKDARNGFFELSGDGIGDREIEGFEAENGFYGGFESVGERCYPTLASRRAEIRENEQNFSNFEHPDFQPNFRNNLNMAVPTADYYHELPRYTPERSFFAPKMPENDYGQNGRFEEISGFRDHRSDRIVQNSPYPPNSKQQGHKYPQKSDKFCKISKNCEEQKITKKLNNLDSEDNHEPFRHHLCQRRRLEREKHSKTAQRGLRKVGSKEVANYLLLTKNQPKPIREATEPHNHLNYTSRDQKRQNFGPKSRKNGQNFKNSILERRGISGPKMGSWGHPERFDIPEGIRDLFANYLVSSKVEFNHYKGNVSFTKSGGVSGLFGRSRAY